MSLAQKLIRGSTVSLIDHGLKISLLFVTTPLMIEHLGKRDYGIWLLALAIVGYFRLLDLGMSFSGARYLGKAVGAKDAREYEVLAGTLHHLFRWIALAAALVTGIVFWAIPAFVPDAAVARTVQWLVLGFGLSTALRYATRIFDVVLKSHVRYDLIGLSSILKTALQGALVIGLLVGGHGLTVLLIAFIAVDAIDQILLIFFARRAAPGMRISTRLRDPGRVPELLRYSATAMATNAGNSLRGGMDPIIVSHVAGIESVPVYNIGARFLTVFGDLINAVFGGNFLAAFSQLEGRNDREALTDRFLATVRLCSAVAVAGGVGLAAFGPTFITRWVGDGFSDSIRVLWLLIPPYTLSLMQYPMWSYFYSIDQQHRLAALTLGAGIFNVALSVTLAAWIGFFGVIWSTVIEMTIGFGLVVPWLVSRASGASLGRYWGVLAGAALRAGLPFAAICWCLRPWMQPDYGRLCLLGLIACAALAPVFWYIVLRPSERAPLLRALGPK